MIEDASKYKYSKDTVRSLLYLYLLLRSKDRPEAMHNGGNHVHHD